MLNDGGKSLRRVVRMAVGKRFTIFPVSYHISFVREMLLSFSQIKEF